MSMSTERDEQAWTAETVTALVDYAENGPPLSDMVRDLVGVARAYAAALRAPQETGWQPDAVIDRFISEMETALPELIQHYAHKLVRREMERAKGRTLRGLSVDVES